MDHGFNDNAVMVDDSRLINNFNDKSIHLKVVDNNSSIISNGSILIPEFLAQEASEHEKQQRQLLQQQEEKQRDMVRDQLELLYKVQERQHELQSKNNENPSMTSHAVQQLLDENNMLISKYYEIGSKASINKQATPPSQQQSNTEVILNQIGQNLKTLTQLMGNNSLTSSQFTSAFHSLAPHLKMNPHSTAAVIAAAATLVCSRYSSSAGSLNSSLNPSANTTPSTSPSWKLFDSANSDISPSYSGDNNIPIFSSNKTNKQKVTSRRLSKPIVKVATPSNISPIVSQLPSLTGATTSPEAVSSVDTTESIGGNKKRSRDVTPDTSKINSDIPDIFERVDSDDDEFESDDDMVVKKKVKKQKPLNVSSPRDTESAKKMRKPGPYGRDEQVPAQEIFAEMEGLPKEFVDAAKQFSKSEARHWLSIKPHVARAGKRSDSLPDPDKWRAWVEITADLPLNNGGPIRRVLEVAVFCAEKCCSDPNILKVLNKALGPSVYKANAAGGCRRMALDMLQTFSESTSSASSKVAKKTKSPQSQPSSKDAVGIESASSNSPASTPNMIPINSSIVPETNNQSTE